MTTSKAVKGNFNTKTTKPVKTNRFSVNTSSLTPSITKIIDGDDSVLITPNVYFTPEVYKQMQFIVDHCKKEVGWMGLVKDMGKNTYLIDKIYIPEQTVSSTETDIDSASMAKLALQVMDEGDDPSRMYAWFHSHVNMGVSPSAQDEHQVAEFIENCPIFIRGIMNKKNDIKVDVYYRDYNTAYNCVKTNIWTESLSKETTDALVEIIKKNVKEQVYHYPVYGGNSYVNTANKSSTNLTSKDISQYYDNGFYDDENYDEFYELYQSQYEDIPSDDETTDYYFASTEWDERVGFSCTKYEKEILDEYTDQEIIMAMEENPWFPYDQAGNFIADEIFEDEN